jgi:putative spermidine/putrescine transport system permease protein
MNEAGKKVKTTTVLLFLLPGVGFLLLLFGLPLLRVIVGSFTNASGNFPSLDTWVELLTTPVYLDGLRFSLWLSIAPTAVSLVISVLLSALMVANERSRRLFGALYRVPLVVPGIVAGFIVLVILDHGGMGSRLLAPFGLALPRLVRDPWGLGAIIALSWKNIPFMTLIIAGAMAAISKDVLAAARTLGAGRITTLWRVQLPLARPGITAAVLLSFIGSLGSFVVPSLLGPSYPLPLSVHMYMQGFQQGNWPMVYAMGTLLSACAIGVLLAYDVLMGRIARTQSKAGVGQ